MTTFCLVDQIIAKAALNRNTLQKWINDIQTKPKLRMYKQFKQDIRVADYVKYGKNRAQRSLIARFRSGTLQLNIELGRFRNIALENRLCEECDTNSIEDEVHFLCICNRYELMRQNMYSKIILKIPDFSNMTVNEKFCYIIQNHVYNILRYVPQLYNGQCYHCNIRVAQEPHHPVRHVRHV